MSSQPWWMRRRGWIRRWQISRKSWDRSRKIYRNSIRRCRSSQINWRRISKIKVPTKAQRPPHQPRTYSSKRSCPRTPNPTKTSKPLNRSKKSSASLSQTEPNTLKISLFPPSSKWSLKTQPWTDLWSRLRRSSVSPRPKMRKWQRPFARSKSRPKSYEPRCARQRSLEWASLNKQTEKKNLSLLSNLSPDIKSKSPSNWQTPRKPINNSSPSSSAPSSFRMQTLAVFSNR